MFRPRVTADMPRNRKVVQAIFQRERNAERRQRLIEAQWRIERRQAKAARSPLTAMRADTRPHEALAVARLPLQARSLRWWTTRAGAAVLGWGHSNLAHGASCAVWASGCRLWASGE
jgi:hypothetical protein